MDLRACALVAAGGAAGTAARYGLALTLPAQPGSWPLATAAVNLAGAFALGLLLARAPSARRRLLAGTGFLGGFTTYSALALETGVLLRRGEVPAGLLYPLLTVALGVLCAAAGARAGRRR
ncbi:hypothetical protein NUM3379_14600 [Kineococcus sp. NUM-3379]